MTFVPTLVRWLVAIFLLFPFLSLIFFIGQLGLPPFEQILKAVEHSLLQAVPSAILSVVIGFFGAMGLAYWKRHERIIKIFFLLPNFIPVLFVMISVFLLIRPFPFGIPGIILVNTVINAGLCAVIIHSLMEEKIGGWSELALVEGASRWQFLKAIYQYLLRDLLWVGLFVFCVCFSSLNVPLLAGRFDVASLEVLIYESISLGESWNFILGLSVLQTSILFLMGMCFVLPQSENKNSHRNLSLLQWKWGVVPILVISTIILFEVLLYAPVGYQQLEAIQWSTLNPFPPLVESLIIGSAVGCMVFVLSCLICYSLPYSRFEKFLSAYMAPSTAVVAFSFYILDFESSRTLVVLALTLLFLPLVFRLNVSNHFRGIVGQIEVARVLGASSREIFWNISLPKCSKAIGLSAGLASFWAIGDFAVSGLLLGSPTLATIGKKLMESYRVEAASLFVVTLLVVGAILLSIFWSIGNVLSEKPLSRLRRL